MMQNADDQTVNDPQQEEATGVAADDRADAATDSAEPSTAVDGAKDTDGETADKSAVASFEPPEGIDPDSEQWQAFVGLAGELGLSPEAAGKLAKLHRDVLRQAVEEPLRQQQAAAERLAEEWREAILADKELGGARMRETTQLAALAMDHYGNEEFRELLEHTGLGNHPVLVRAFRDLGRKLAEDSPAQGRPAGTPEDVLSKMYPKMRT